MKLINRCSSAFSSGYIIVNASGNTLMSQTPQGNLVTIESSNLFMIPVNRTERELKNGNVKVSFKPTKDGNALIDAIYNHFYKKGSRPNRIKIIGTEEAAMAYPKKVCLPIPHEELNSDMIIRCDKFIVY